MTTATMRNAAAKNWTRRPRARPLRGSTAGGGTTPPAARRRGERQRQGPPTSAPSARSGAVGDGSFGSTGSQRLEHVSCRSEPIAWIGGQGGRATSRNGRGRARSRGAGIQAPSGQRLDHDAPTATDPTARWPAVQTCAPGRDSRVYRGRRQSWSYRRTHARDGPHAEAFCDAEVRDLRVPIVEEDVARLDVPVHDAELVAAANAASDSARTSMTRCSEEVRAPSSAT